MDADREPFAALNADPVVMEYFPDLLTRQQSDILIEAIEPSREAHFTPAVEIGWRLARAAWGEGYATEAARASLAFGFEEIGLDQIVSFASAGNMRSRAVMERVGMTRNPDDDFDHPGLPDADPLRRHVLYRIDRASADEELDGDYKFPRGNICSPG